MEDKHICLAKEKKKEIKHANCWNLLYWLSKIVCILNGVCCAIVHLHCFNVKKQLLLKNLMYEQRVQNVMCLLCLFFLSPLRHLGIAHPFHVLFWCWTYKAILGATWQFYKQQYLKKKKFVHLFKWVDRMLAFMSNLIQWLYCSSNQKRLPAMSSSAYQGFHFLGFTWITKVSVCQ